MAATGASRVSHDEFEPPRVAEIWSTTAWEAYYAEAEEAFADNDEEVIPGIF